MKNKKQHHEEHVDETWLIPYADMLTLLLALFIVMFAMGQIDKAKASALSEQFNMIFSGGTGLFEQDGRKPISTNGSGESLITEGTIEEGKLNQVKRALQKEIKEKGYADKVKVVLNGDGLEISIQDTVLFQSGEAEIVEEFEPMLGEIAKMLKGFENNIKVAGHTDNVPIHTARFRSNWDLSSMRAINVMNFLIDTAQLDSKKFSIQAYGEYRPKFDNATAEGRAKNRRVEIFIERRYSLDTVKKFEEIQQ